MDHGTIVVGGGLVGVAIAYGWLRPALAGESTAYRVERVDVQNGAAA